MKKTRGRKSRDTVPLCILLYSILAGFGADYGNVFLWLATAYPEEERDTGPIHQLRSHHPSWPRLVNIWLYGQVTQTSTISLSC
jgi:hypothetical protein